MTNLKLLSICFLILFTPVAFYFEIVNFAPLDYITDTQLHFYEDRVAHEKVATHLSSAEVERRQKNTARRLPPIKTL